MKVLQLFAVFFTGIMIISCTSPRDKAENQIISLEQTVYSDTTGLIDKTKYQNWLIFMLILQVNTRMI